MPIKASFDDASVSLIGFLGKLRLPTTLIWVVREELTGRRRHFFVHPSPSPVNPELYRRWYARGVALGRSVTLRAAWFTDDGRAHCYVDVSRYAFDPKDPAANGGLHLNVQTDHVDPLRVPGITRSRSALTFRLRRMLCRLRGESAALSEVPSLADLRG